MKPKFKSILYCVLAIVVMVLAQVIAMLVKAGLDAVHMPEPVCYLIAGVLYPVLTYTFISLFVKKIMHRDMPSFNIPKPGIRLRWFIIGILLPVVVSVILMLFPGELIKGNVTPDPISNIFYNICFGAIGAAFAEEMIFRGVIMTLLKEQFGVKVAVLAPSIVFGLLHLIGAEISLMLILQLFVAGTLVGIMFSLIALTENSVWNSGIVHFFWNALTFSGVMLISNKVSEYSIFTYVLSTDSVILSGGDFGLDISIVSIIGYITVIMVAYKMLKGRNVDSEDDVEKA